MKIGNLADNKNLLPTVAKWYFDEWGYLNKETTWDKEIEKLQPYLNKSKIPMIFLAIDNDQLLGVAQLKYHEMSIYPKKTHWLGGVYVAHEYRGNGIAKKMITELIHKAGKLNVKTLYLQTEMLTGGLYLKMGWEPLEQVNYHGTDVLVMENHIQ